MIYFARGDYNGPGRVVINRLPPGMGRRLFAYQWVDELRAETAPHDPVLVGPFVVRTSVVMWLRSEGQIVLELPAQQLDEAA